MNQRPEDHEHPPVDEESLARIAARRALARARREAATPEFGRLLRFWATGAAGDALIALALAGSLFFAVPETTARDRVALYLALTAAPFAIVSPLLARWLDRHRGSMRVAMVVSALGRGTLAWLLSSRLDSLLLFPIAFGVLVLSRAALVVRGAMLPALVPEGRTLVAANSSMSKVAAVSGIVAVPFGLLLIQWPGPRYELLFAAFVYYLGAVPALLLPSPRGRRTAEEQISARAVARAVSVRQAVFAIASMRLLIGFLIFHLAFALRREDISSIGLGALIAGAAMGSLIGAVVSPRLRRVLREEGILVAALMVAGITGIVVGRYFSLVTATALVFVFGVASGSAKVAFDSLVQRDVAEGARGWTFARYESGLQLAWVLGAFAPLIAPIPSGAGVVAAGVAANVAAIVYVTGRQRARRGRAPK